MEAIFSETFMDSDSEDEFLWFTADDFVPVVDMTGDLQASDVSSVSDSSSDEEDEAVSSDRAPSGYSHPWLRDFAEVVGPVGVDANISEVGMFRLFFTDDILNMLVTETNRYHEQVKDLKGEDAGASSRVSLWKDVTADEMRSFIALVLLMGLTNRSSYELYWSVDSLLECPGFREVMSRNRFLAILSFLHLVDNTTTVPRGEPGHSKAFKIRSFVDSLLPLFQRHYTPSKELSLDESMIAFKGRTSLMQYMPKKASKWGMKAWVLADSDTGYLWNWQLYLRKEDNVDPTRGLAHRVVTSLVAPLYGKGHVVFMDNFFSSPDLFKELAGNQTGACGTLRTNRRGVPEAVRNRNPKVGEPPITVTADGILYLSWFDRRPVNLMTSAHGAQTFTKRVRSKHHAGNVRVVDKPCAIQSYSCNMGGVDRVDKQLTYYLLAHRCCKWWKKIFFYLMEVCFANSLVLWRAKHPGRVKAEQFRLQIVHGLLGMNVPRAGTSKRGRRASNAPDRLSGAHYPALNPKRKSGGKVCQFDCVVCSDRDKKRHQTQFFCTSCSVALCPHPCFGRYHTLVNFKVDCTPDLHK